MLRVLPFVVLLPVSITTMQGAAAACPPPRDAALNVHLRETPVSYRVVTGDMLATRAQQSGTFLGAGRRVLGLTVNQYHLDLAIETETGRDGPDGACSRLRMVNVTPIVAPEVLIDGRFPLGSCQRQAILDHEFQHVAVFRDSLAHEAPAFDVALRSALPPSIPVTAGRRPEEAYADLVRAALKPLIDEVSRRADDANRRLDTPESYASVLRRCPSW